jgi:hypothetical protein
VLAAWDVKAERAAANTARATSGIDATSCFAFELMFE